MITPHLTVREGKVYYPDDLKDEVAETERRAEEMVGNNRGSLRGHSGHQEGAVMTRF